MVNNLALCDTNANLLQILIVIANTATQYQNLWALLVTKVSSLVPVARGLA